MTKSKNGFHRNENDNGDALAIASLNERRKRDLNSLRNHLLSSQSIRQAVSGVSSKTKRCSPSYMLKSTSSSRQKKRDWKDTKEERNQKNTQRATTLLRVLLLDVPLGLLFGLFLVACCVRFLYHEYYVPSMEAYARAASDENIAKEITYYERTCTLKDISTHNFSDMVLQKDTPIHEAVNVMMTHGATVIPQILQEDTMQELHKFISRRNTELTASESIPLDGQAYRASFGIDATEDPIVPVALHQVSTHPIVKNLLEELVGDDPAVTEITSISAYYGAQHQGWHPDVKPDGNGLKFARTYSHSFSLFIPLQDTTGAMGATQMCPGTHYCANEDLTDLCDRYGQQLSAGFPGGIWKRGYGAMFNQQIWHRGVAHSDHTAPGRIMFIVSFIGRPRPGRDMRQLSRGTYFHMKWNMWGHTMRDLQDAHKSMAKPFSLLRCFGLWKPANRNFGYDLLTSAAMRIANNQNGMTPEELPEFVYNSVDPSGFPKFLQGPVLEADDAWAIYLETTIDNCFYFFCIANIIVIALYGLFVLALALRDQTFEPIAKFFVHVLFSHGLPALLAWLVIVRVEMSPWGNDVKQGTLMKSPFPAWIETATDPTISLGPTTLPERDDILIASRFGSKYIGAYNKWIDFHPGNVAFQNLVEGTSGMPASLSSAWAQSVANNNLMSGRFLQQDWRTGDWRVWEGADLAKHIEYELAKSRNSVLSFIDKGIDMMIAEHRFEHPDSVIRTETIGLLMNIRTMLHVNPNSGGDSPSLNPMLPSLLDDGSFLALKPFSKQVKKSFKLSHSSREWIVRGSNNLDEELLHRDLVWVQKGGERTSTWERGELLRVGNETMDVIMQGGDLLSVASDLILQLIPLTEGIPVRATSPRTRMSHVATVIQVRPTGFVDVQYEGGAIERHIEKFVRLDL